MATKTRRRKPYAWERGLVKSSIPAGDRNKKCSACPTVVPARALKFGYCPACWKT